MTDDEERIVRDAPPPSGGAGTTGGANDMPEQVAEVDEIAPEEIVDGLPVLADEAPVPEHSAPGPVPARHAAALAATGFVAGAATVAVIQRRRARVTPRRAKRRKGRVGFGEVVSSNSFLVDVHLLRRD